MKIEKLDGPPNRFRYDWEPIVAFGKAHPGKWFKPDVTFKYSIVGALQRGNNRLLPPDEWDVKTQDTHWGLIDGKRYCSLVLRYNPEKKKARK